MRIEFMKKIKYMTAICLSIFAVIMLLPFQARAAGKIDPGHEVSLTITYSDGETALAGAQFDLYRIASVDEYGELTLEKQCEQFPVNLNKATKEDWKTLASTLEGYVLRDNIMPSASGKTDERGQLMFDNKNGKLTTGLYLVLGQRLEQGNSLYEATPFVVMLPGMEEQANAWTYEVTVSPKFESEPVEEIPDAVSRKVIKKWEDSAHEEERPKEIRVQLLREGEVFDTISLNEKNNWRYTWNDLDNQYQWTVVEKEVAGYSVQTERQGITFVVTNTYDEDLPYDKPEQSGGESGDEEAGGSTSHRLPQTGQLWWPVPLLIVCGLLLIVFGLIRRRGAGNGQ